VELAKDAGLLLEGRRNMSTEDIVALKTIPAADLRDKYEPQQYLKTVWGQDSMKGRPGR
jgi:hypothetical protein